MAAPSKPGHTTLLLSFYTTYKQPSPRLKWKRKGGVSKRKGRSDKGEARTKVTKHLKQRKNKARCMYIFVAERSSLFFIVFLFGRRLIVLLCAAASCPAAGVDQAQYYAHTLAHGLQMAAASSCRIDAMLTNNDASLLSNMTFSQNRQSRYRSP